MKEEMKKFKYVTNDSGFVDLNTFKANCRRDADIQRRFNEMVTFHDADRDGRVSLEDFLKTLQAQTDFSAPLVECAILDFEEMEVNGFANFEKFKEGFLMREIMKKEMERQRNRMRGQMGTPGMPSPQMGRR